MTEMGKNEVNEQRADKREAYQPVTVRFTREAWEAIRDMAAEQGCPMAELVRVTLDKRLKEYLGAVRFMDYDQGKEIQKTVTALLNEISDVKNELRRIGVNYNQEIRLRQIQAKYGHPRTTTGISQKMKEESEVRDESKVLSKTELDNLMKRYEDATGEVGDLLCRILT
jgi:hypothetical protein